MNSRSFVGFFLGVLCALLSAIAISAGVTNCQEDYEKNLKWAKEVYEETVNSMVKNARLNNLDIVKELAKMRQDHDKDLKQLRDTLRECQDRADEQEKERREEARRQEKQRREEKEQADKAQAATVTSQLEQLKQKSDLRQIDSLSWKDRNNAVGNLDPKALESNAETLRKEAQKLSQQASDAGRKGDRATSSSLYSAAQELNSQANLADSFATGAKLKQQQDKWDIQRKQGQEEWDRQVAKRKESWAKQDAEVQKTLQSQILESVGEQLGNAGKNVVNEYGHIVKNPRPKPPGRGLASGVGRYVETAEENVDSLIPIADTVAEYIDQKIRPKVEQILNNPDAQPVPADRDHSYSPGLPSLPPATFYSASPSYAPPANAPEPLPNLAGPATSVRPLTEQEINDSFEVLKGRSKKTSQIPDAMPLENMLRGLEPRPTPAAAPPAQDSELGVFDKWLTGAKQPSPTPKPTPPLSQPVDLFGGSPSKK